MSEVNSKNSFNIALFTWVLLILLLRPSIVGSYYNKEVFVLLVINSIIIVAFSKRHTIKINANKLILFALFLTIFIYFLIQGLMLSESISTVLNSSLLIGGITALLFIMSTNNVQKSLIHYFVKINFVLAVSGIISFILILSFSYSTVEILSFDVLGYKTPHSLVFPYSVYWSKLNISGLSIPRYTSIYKEPGVAQAFFLTAFWFSVMGKYKKIIKYSLFLGTILTFSTAGFINITISTIAYIFAIYKPSIIYKSPLRSIFATIILIVMMLFINNEINTKKVSSSGLNRFDSYTRSIELLNKHPLFGTGYYSSRDVAGNQIGNTQSIGLLGVVYQIGYIGLILYLCTWLYSFTIINKSEYIYLYIPFLLTLLLFQPNYNTPIIWVLLSINFRHVFDFPLPDSIKHLDND